MAKSKEESLSSFTGHPHTGTTSFMIPGLRDEPMALLSFILRVLDGKHQKMIRGHLEFFLHLDFQVRTPEAEDLMNRLSAYPALLDFAVDGMVDAMRKMAALWIESGKSRTDREVDTPADRNVEDILPGQDYSLFQMIDHILLRSYPRYTKMTRDGSLRIMDTFPRFDTDTGHWRLQDALKAHGAKWAAFHFSNLLNSSCSRLIARCDHCKAHFAYKRARLRTVKHGVSCPACGGKAAVKRTETSRARRLETAARAWFECESRNRAVTPEWIALQVNKSHGTAFGRRWVTQNLSEIQKRVEALRNAKG